MQRSRRKPEARLGAEQWNSWLTMDSRIYYTVTVNPRNRVRIDQHPELMMCLRWAFSFAVIAKWKVNKGGTAQDYNKPVVS